MADSVVFLLRINKQYGDDLCGWISTKVYRNLPCLEDVEEAYILLNQGYTEFDTLVMGIDYSFTTLDFEE